MTLAQILAALAACGGLQTPGAVESAMREAAASPERDFRQLIDMVRAAVGAAIYPAKPANDRWVSLTAIYADRAIVELGGRKYQYGYTVAATPSGDQVTLGAPVEVVETYVPSVPADKTVLRESATEAAFREAQDGSIEVTLIRGGRSGNLNYYPDAPLREAVPMFEGVRVFSKSDADHLAGKGKDVHNLIGGIYNVRFVEGKTPDTGSLVGTFKPIDPADSTVKKMVEAVKRGMQGLLGLSIDASARTKKRKVGAEQLREAVRFVKVHSVDLIVEPGAGGGLDRLTEAATDPESITNEGNAMPLWKQRMLEAIKAKDPAKHATIQVDTISDDEVTALYEAVCGSLVPGASSDPGVQRVAESLGDNTPLTRADLQVYELRGAARDRVNVAKLPQASKDRLQAQITSAAADRLTEAAVGELIKAEGEYVARLTESGTVRVPMFGEGSIEVGDRSLSMREMLDAFFDPAHKNHGSVQSFKECYIEMTGDRRITGRLRECDQSRMVESLGSSSLGEVLGDAVARRMLSEYRAAVDFDGWRQIVNVVPVNDFRMQHRTRWGGYGDLPVVAESADYMPLTSPTDEEATYSVAKRGGTEDVTLEMITNDDVGVIRRIPTKLSRAAKRTLAKFAFDFLRSNAVIYDGKALFHADHNNLFTTALDKTSLAAHPITLDGRTAKAWMYRTDIDVFQAWSEIADAIFDLVLRGKTYKVTFDSTRPPAFEAIPMWNVSDEEHNDEMRYFPFFRFLEV